MVISISPTAITTSSYVPSEGAEIDFLAVGFKMATEYQLALSGTGLGIGRPIPKPPVYELSGAESELILPRPTEKSDDCPRYTSAPPREHRLGLQPRAAFTVCSDYSRSDSSRDR